MLGLMMMMMMSDTFHGLVMKAIWNNRSMSVFEIIEYKCVKSSMHVYVWSVEFSYFFSVYFSLMKDR